MRKLLQSKLHGIRVTGADLNYVGSITLDQDYIDGVGLIPYQEVFIVNNNNGERFETYVIPAPRGSKKVELNGAAARKVQVGDTLIIMGFHFLTQREIDENDFEPPIIKTFSYNFNSIFPSEVKAVSAKYID